MSVNRDNAFFRMLADNSPLFIGMCDMQYKPFYLNEAGCRLVGLNDLQHFKGTRVQDYFFSDDLNFILNEFFPRVLREGRANTEIRFRHFKTGNPIWMMYDVFILRDDSEKSVGLATVSRDINERKIAEAAANETNRRIQSIIDNTPAIIYALDLDRRFILANSATAELFDSIPERIIGKHRCELMPRNDAKQHEINDQKVIDAGRSFEFEETSEIGGHLTTWLTNKFPLRDTQGQIYGVAGISTDITNRKMVENEMHVASANKDIFLATLAHELRNPLTPISHAISVLKTMHGAGDPSAPLLDMAESQAVHLIRLVDDLLELSRISRGKVELRKEPVQVSKIISTALELCRPLIDEKGHTLRVTGDHPDLWTFGDPVRLSQILANLINNAAKYTRFNGLIEIDALRVGNEVVLRVRDNGVGISADMLKSVFDYFVQDRRSVDMSEGGLGIGLALVKEFLELHGGHVEARSAGLGLGSEFVVHLPLWSRGEPVSRSVTEERIKGAAQLRALVIDDNHDVADSFCCLLDVLGVESKAVYDGASGIVAIEEFLPDIVFLDIGMPNLDGYETARRIRERDYQHPFILVALTGWGQEEARVRSREAGFDFHITKPASDDEIEALLLRAESARNKTND